MNWSNKARGLRFEEISTKHNNSHQISFELSCPHINYDRINIMNIGKVVNLHMDTLNHCLIIFMNKAYLVQTQCQQIFWICAMAGRDGCFVLKTTALWIITAEILLSSWAVVVSVFVVNMMVGLCCFVPSDRVYVSVVWLHCHCVCNVWAVVIVDTIHS